MSAALAPTVFIVDDDAPLLRALSRLLRESGWQVATFASAQDFLAQRDPRAPGCLVLDVHLPGLNGLALQRPLVEDGPALPIVFLSGHGDIPMTVQALKAGAVDRRQVEQADRRRSGCGRADGEVPPRAHHGAHARAHHR
jgi:FixJ family two-component response regulator